MNPILRTTIEDLFYEPQLKNPILRTSFYVPHFMNLRFLLIVKSANSNLFTISISCYKFDQTILGSYDDRIFNDFSCMCDKACCLHFWQHKNGIFEIISIAAKSEKMQS